MAEPSHWLVAFIMSLLPFTCGGSKTSASNEPKVAWNDTKNFEMMYIAWIAGHTKCPSTIAELVTAAGKKGAAPLDPWGRSYRLTCPSTHSMDIDVCSDGPDMAPNTPDDVCNWLPQP